MTEPSRQPALRGALAELERTAPMPADLPDRVLDGAASRPPGHRSRWRRLAPLAAAVVVLVAAAAAAVISSSRPNPAPGVPDGTAPTPWQTFVNQSMRFSLRYPIFWRASPARFQSEFVAGIVFLSTEHVPTPCHTSHDRRSVACVIAPVRLDDGDVYILWAASSVLPKPRETALDRASGRPTTIDGHRAKVDVTGPAQRRWCQQSDGARIVEVSIAQGMHELIQMDACLAGSPQQLAALTQIVLRSARSVRLGG